MEQKEHPFRTPPFSLANLDEAQHRLLADLIRLVVRADARLGAGERAAVAAIVDEIGEEFWQLLERSSGSYEEIIRAAELVESKDAQELIYGTLYELSMHQGIVPAEAVILDRLSEIWHLEITEKIPEDL
jgi:hypothetical protein